MWLTDRDQPKSAGLRSLSSIDAEQRYRNPGIWVWGRETGNNAVLRQLRHAVPAQHFDRLRDAVALGGAGVTPGGAGVARDRVHLS